MPKGWRTVSLGEIAEVRMGQQLSPSRRSGARARPYLRAANVGTSGIDLDDVNSMDFSAEEEERYALRPGDILLVEGGNEKSVGCPVLVSNLEEGLCFQNTLIRCRISDLKVVIPEFLYFSLLHSFECGQFAGLAQGTTILHLGQRRAEVFQIDLPPIVEQERIVDFFKSIKRSDSALNCEDATLRNARDAVLHDMLDRSQPKSTEVSLGQLAILQIGRTPPRDDAKYWTSDLTLPFCTISDMSSKCVVPLREGVTAVAEADGKARRSPAGALLMSFKLTIGRVGFAGCDLFPNEAIVEIRPDESMATREFLYLELGSRDLTGGSGQAAKGKTLNRSSLEAIRVQLPPLEEQARIVSVIEAIDARVAALETQRSETSTLFGAAMVDLLSGAWSLDETYDSGVGL